MTPFGEFARQLLDEGKAVLRERPAPIAEQQREVKELLAQAFVEYRLEVAGPLLNFDAAIGVAAAEVAWHACWFLVNHDDPPGEVEKRLTLPPPTTPSSHLSADLTLRYLTTVYRRAHAADPTDLLATRLAAILRQWPLTGVMADVDDGPISALDFGGHHGLLLLYAERWVQSEKAAWKPEGKGWEYVELVNRHVPAAQATAYKPAAQARANTR